MKRILQTLLFALLVIFTFNLAAASKTKGEPKGGAKSEAKNKNLKPKPPDPVEQAEQNREREARERAAKKPEAQSTALPQLQDLSAPRELAEDEESDPDLPQHLRGRIDKAEYMRLRDEYFATLRGLDPLVPLDVTTRRNAAIDKLELQVRRKPQAGPLADPPWTNIGPAPVPNGQTQQFPTVAPVSGRATCVVVDPTDSNKVYLGTAQGGVWRSLDGGTTWTPIFDAAQSLAVGALALAPSNPTILYVGTGEPNNSADSYFGVGVYRIDNVGTTADLSGPINPAITTGSGGGQITTTCFTGRAISKILVDPNDPATIFVSTSAGVSGAAGNALTNLVPPLGLRGVFRSNNATSAPAAVTFQKLIVNTDGSLDSAPATGNTSIFDMVFEPGNANNLLVTTSGSVTGGAVYRSTNALAATPTFTSTLFPGFNGLVMKLAINKVGAVVTVYVGTNEPPPAAVGCGTQSGRVRKSVDGGVTWSVPLPQAEGYCGGQCSYDNPIAVDPNDANIVYIAGNARGSCSDVLARSADGGTTFIRDDEGLHADSHGFAMDPLTTPTTVWFVNDGGVWKRQDAAAGTPWINRNTNLSTIQFVSMAVHPTNPFLSLGGTQDNGTEAMTLSNGNWVSAESGDGGFALIDQSSTDATNVTMYHTFFNATNNFIGFDRTNLGTCLPPPDADKDSWEFRGGGFANDPTLSCDGTAFTLSNGILATDGTLFYAPMALGPGTPNTLYFGTSKLYRSIDRGDTMVLASASPLLAPGTAAAGAVISAIGISPTNDNIRIVGTRNGAVFVTTTGVNPVNATFPIPTNATGSTTNRHIARAVVDPLNSNTAYVTIAYYTNPATAGQIWRTTNLNGAPPTWTSIGNSATGLPNIPVNGFVVDGADPGFPGVSVLYAGTDIGVYRSTDSGASWTPFGSPVLPRVAVFDMAIQASNRILRVGTHGRGAWQIPLPGGCIPPDQPTVTPGGPTTFCQGDSVTLTSSAGTSYQWYDGVTLLAGETNQAYVATTAGNYNVVVTVGCASSPSASTTVTVNPLPPSPTITPGGPTTFCSGGSVTLMSSSATGNQWYDGVTLLAGETNQNYVATTSGSYNVVVTDGNSCSSVPSASTVVTVNSTPQPTVTPGGPTTFCTGGSVTLTSSAGTSYQWYDGVTSLGGETNQTYVATTSGNYNVVVTTNSCPSVPSASTAVTVNPIPPMPTISPSGSVIACDSGTLTSSSATGNQWYYQGNLLPGETNQTLNVDIDGDYTVVVTLNGCSSPASAATSIDAHVRPGPAFLSAGGPTTFCAGGSVTLMSNSATGIQWYLDGNPLPNPNSQNRTVSVGGTYTVTLNDQGCISGLSNSIVVTVNPLPNTPTATPGGPTTFCAGGSVTLTSNSGSGNQWYLNANPIGGATNPTYNATASGDYTVRVTDGNSCTSAASPAVTVTVITTPQPTVTPGGPTTFCTGGSVTLTSSSASGNQWYNGLSLLGGETNQTYVATTSGNYNVVVTANGCPSVPSASTAVTVNPIPATPTITPGGPTTFCAGGSVLLTSSSGSGNQWYLDGNPIGGATNATYSATATGGYTVIVTTSGCSSPASAATNVTVNPVPAMPTITPGGPTTFCAGGSVLLTSSSASGNQWRLNGSPIGGATSQTYNATAAGDYTVTVTATGCTSAPSATTTVTINPNPNATITAPANVNTGSTGNTASVANAGAGATYAWSITNGSITAGNNTPSITFTAGAVGPLSLNVTVTTAAGCSDSKSANVNVTLPTVTVTSVTPNNGSSLGGTNVTIAGSGFNSGAAVTFGGSAATNVVVVNSGQITAKTPAHAAGAVNVTVTNTDTSTNTLNNGYTYNQQNFDPNGDGMIDPSDIFYLVAYLFTGGPAPAGAAGPVLSGDANGDGVVDPADIFYVVLYLFGGGPAPHLTGGVTTMSIAEPISGALSLGQAVHRDGRWFVPVIVSMDPSSATPQAFSVRVRFSGTTSDAVMHRGDGLAPIFEISRRTADSVSYLVAFNQSAPFVLGASRSATIAEIEVTAASAMRLDVDAAVTMLVGGDGAQKATVANGGLRVRGTMVGAPAPARQQNPNDQK